MRLCVHMRYALMLFAYTIISTLMLSFSALNDTFQYVDFYEYIYERLALELCNYYVLQFLKTMIAHSVKEIEKEREKRV